MKVSKSQFINLMRCDRYGALNELYYEKDKAIVSFNDEITVDKLMSLENKYSLSTILDSMYKEDEEITSDTDARLEMMMPYYNQLEQLSGKAIKDIFGGKIIYDLNTFNQQQFTFEKDGFNFFCFLDGFQEDDNYLRIFETKATTSSKFSLDQLGYKYSIDKEKYHDSFFVERTHGIYAPREDVEIPHDKYYQVEKKLMDRYSDVGKYIYDLAFQRYVFENSTKSSKNKEYYLVVLNHEYIFKGDLNSNGEPEYGNDIIKFYDLTSLTKKMMKQLDEDTDLVIRRLNELNADKTSLGSFCQKGKNTECPFYDICYQDFPKENSIFIYTDKHHGFKDSESGEKHDFFDLINQGYRHALDIPESYMNRANNLIQRNVIASGKPYYNKNKIRDGIKQLSYPIYHLDFESFNAPLPRFKGENPYQQSLFQYSVHIERANDKCDFDLDHYGYLAKDHSDVRLELVESLLDVIKDDNGSVLVYNVGFEKGRLKELQKLFPKYHDRLENIISRLFDLQYIVKNNKDLYLSLGYDKEEASEYNFYDEKLEGSYSIKKVLPIFSNLTYEGLRVGNGTDAMEAYSRLPQLKGLEFEETYLDLVNYCKQDTWAMFEILKELRKI